MKIIKVKFPKSNLSHTLYHVDQKLNESYDEENCVIAKTIYLKDDEYKSISRGLLRKNKIWNKIGGKYRVRINKNVFLPIVKVVKVLNMATKEVFFVDTRKTNHAINVGRLL